MIEIDKNIPFPNRKNRKSYNSKYPWEEMEIGDSFKVLDDGKNSGNNKRRLDTFRTVTSRANNRYKKRFFVSFDGENNLRCWRVE